MFSGSLPNTIARVLAEGSLEQNLKNTNASVNIFSLLIFFILNLSQKGTFPKTTSHFKKKYDYIIVGAGSAGSVVANRLSELPCVNVLLLEAGAEGKLLSEVPGASRMIYKSDIDWLYQTVPQKYSAKHHTDRRVYWNSGKALGGSSELNAMLYVRGNKRNYDDWAEEGAEGWSYEEVLPYFKKLEDNRNIDELDPGYHATGGPVTIEKPKCETPFKKPVMESLYDLGFKETDPNGKRQTGIYDLQGFLRNGRRCSTAKAYLVPAENRPNLDIVKNAFVKKILIKNKKAYGVEFDFEGKSHKVLARKEVIISSGAVRTPQILMLSGIGPRKELEKWNIPVIVELPVGENLQDHPAFYMPFLLPDDIKTLFSRELTPEELLKYSKYRSGTNACPCQVALMAFIDGFNTTDTSPDFPKQELYFADYDSFDAQKNSNLKPEVFQKVFGPYESKPMYACLVSLLQVKSRGKITLNTTDPYEYPLIDPRYYENDDDMQDMIEGMKVCYRVGTSPQLQAIGSRPFLLYPGCEKYISDDDKLFRCYAKVSVITFWHPVGTARMGRRDDPRSVVDPQLRVIGIDGLRVVNAAVMPIIPSGNTNAPTIMIAEKASDMIKEGIKCSKDNNRIEV